MYRGDFLPPGKAVVNGMLANAPKVEERIAELEKENAELRAQIEALNAPKPARKGKAE